MTFRKSIFWLHLIAGLLAGLVIAIMAFTGAVLAFEKDLVAWAERDARCVLPPAGDAPRLSLDELARRLQIAQPEAKPTGITVSADPAAAVTFSIGRETAYYLNPYTGEIRQPASTTMHDFMHLMEDWHRALALTDVARDTGRAITGACNATFLFLSVSGLYLWWPRKWRTKGLKRSLWFIRTDDGKARDWNWHNVIGFWSLPVLIVLTASGMVISYRWASDLVYRSVGETPPVSSGPGNLPGPAIELTPPPDASPASYQTLMASAQASTPTWETITLRFGAAPGRKESPKVIPITAIVSLAGHSPPSASTQLALDPFTGQILRQTPFEAQTPGRRLRSWLRFLHTGEALGRPGQAVAGIACLGSLVLVWTGFSLAWRRFLRSR